MGRGLPTGLERALEVVDHGQKRAGELGLAASEGLGGVLGHPLAVVLEVRPRSLRQLEVLIALALGLTELVEISLDLIGGAVAVLGFGGG